jgi:hypothetical protein
MLGFFTRPLGPKHTAFPNDSSAQALLAALSAAASSFHWLSFCSSFLLLSLIALPTALLFYVSTYTYYCHLCCFISPLKRQPLKSQDGLFFSLLLLDLSGLLYRLMSETRSLLAAHSACYLFLEGCLLGSLFKLKEGRSIFLQYITELLLDDKESDPRRQYSS